MKYTFIIFLFALELYGCNHKEKILITAKPDIEMQVINDVLPYLIPEHPPCMVIPIEGESPKEYDKRLQEYYDKVDSVGKKIEIVRVLTALDSNTIESSRPFEKASLLQLLLKAPRNEKRIDSLMVRKIDGIQIIIVNEPRRSKRSGLSDCYTLGQFNISRVGFNKDSTRAAFSYFIDNGSCFITDGGKIEVEFRDKKWQIKNK